MRRFGLAGSSNWQTVGYALASVRGLVGGGAIGTVTGCGVGAAGEVAGELWGEEAESWVNWLDRARTGVKALRDLAGQIF